MCLSNFQSNPLQTTLFYAADSILSFNASDLHSEYPDLSDVSISLREIIDRFANMPDIMDLLLKAKIEEDKRLTEQYRCKVELVHEEMKQRELGSLEQQSDIFEFNIDSYLHSDEDTPKENLTHHPTITTSMTKHPLIDNFLSKLDSDVDFLQPAELNNVNNNHEYPLKRKATENLSIDYYTRLNPKQGTVQPFLSKKSPEKVTMKTIKRKARIQQSNKKERPQQKFMQMMKLVRHP